MPPGRAPVQRQFSCRSPWWRWAGCGSTRGACGTARFPHGGRVGHGCAGSAIAREADGRQDVGGGRRGGGDERAGGAQGDEAEVLSTLLSREKWPVSPAAMCVAKAEYRFAVPPAKTRSPENTRCGSS